MAVVDTDIVVYGSASMPDDDTPTGIGGAIDLTKRVIFTDIGATTGTVSFVSNAAGDTTQTVTVYGRDAAGILVNEGNTITGTTPVVTTQTFERITKIVISATYVGDITFTDVANASATIVITLGTGSVTNAELEIRRPFYNAVAEASGGATRTYYEKIFFKNNNAVSALTSATIAEIAGGIAAKVAFALESTLNGTDNNGIGNRQTQTGGYTFDSTTKNVANTQNHTAGAAQGCWIEMTLNAGDTATNSQYTLRESGETA